MSLHREDYAQFAEALRSFVEAHPSLMCMALGFIAGFVVGFII